MKLMYMHQDWTPVVVCKNKPKDTSKNEKSACATVTASGVPAWKVEANVDDDIATPIKLVSSTTANAIAQGRVAKKMTREALARAINVKVSEIADIETCKAVENRQLLAKIRKVLGIAKLD